MISSILKWLNRTSRMRIPDQVILENQVENQVKAVVKEAMMTRSQESQDVRQVPKNPLKTKEKQEARSDSI